ncbi:hypothetical protein AN639_04565 [Candidatus Epulonipiscium fishelsonii]|uniref:Uncharacterized protein n=1 Tax=Candidatus Epulonipiscium fishelsonii TaxID=77094 RepID=A0ACC8XEX3_9FIRM|nr:hypothetical protein AN639_04565 [Epulopiscium sp. SCG-B05WGA-EpuloA1]ONI41932.1 hypothetical protein AN396_02730 [Epulopiscium sp. SCG-B11WGA-EpuloA1]
MNKENFQKIINDNWDSHVKRYQKYISQPSVSNTGHGVRDMAHLLVEDFKELGCQEAKLYETAGWPVVYASLDVGAPKTILMYGMYDVQPVDGEIWRSHPFEANIIDDEEYGKIIVGRGARNQKGPLAAVVNAIKTILDAEGTLPVNIKFLVEGEEEMGSRHLPGVVEELLDEINACDCIFFHAFQASATEKKVKQYLGTKGITEIQIKFKGGDWGGPAERHIHAEYAIWVNNPIWELIKAFGTIKDKDDKILIEGFYDDVVGEIEGDAEVFDRLLSVWSAETWKKEYGVRKFKNNMEVRAALENYTFMPELNIDGIIGGYTGEGLKTLLPHDVTVKMDLRTVPNMDVEKTVGQIKAHFEKLGVMDRMEFSYTNAYGYCRTKQSDPAIQAMFAAQEEMGYTVQPWPCLAGSAPLGMFQKYTDIPIVTGGLGHAALPHSPNEFAVVETLKESEMCCILFIYKFAELE